jgi:hypothetical protein
MVRPYDPPAIIEFGRFSILPHRRQLLAEGQPIRLGGRAFDVLMALIAGAGVGWGTPLRHRAAFEPETMQFECPAQIRVVGLNLFRRFGRDLKWLKDCPRYVSARQRSPQR